MYVINADNVREALPKAMRLVMELGHSTKTRNGDAIVLPKPVNICYTNPKQHVLIDHVRDANPFFHLMEAMWMLAGRDDGAFLDHYVKNFSKDFGTEGRIVDAYGYRWRHGLGYDQLEEIIEQLKQTPNTRQAVLQMWGAGRDDLTQSNPKPCNLVASFHIIDENQLNMTVFNRSNDLILGCCGANAVHFAILQEYIASMVGVKMGSYWQVSTNLHLYKKHLDKVSPEALDEEYERTEPLIKYPRVFDEELKETMLYIDEMHEYREGYMGNISNPFLSEVVIPMATAHWMYKARNFKEALDAIESVRAEDWRRAGKEWLERRIK
jgi:thymidylate synthase